MICCNAAMTDIGELRVGTGHAVFYSEPMAGKAQNEDSFALIELDQHTCVLAVADGVGSTAGADVASRTAIEVLERHVRAADTAGDLTAGILDAFNQAHLEISALQTNAATTLIAALIHDGHLRAFNTGDSGLLVTGQRGRQKYRTVFHSPIGYAEEAGFVSEREAMRHEERHIVFNVLGVSPMSVEIAEAQQLAPYDTVVLGTDGLWDNLLLREVTELVRRGPLDAAGRNLKDTLSRRMHSGREGTKPDDATFILYRPR